VRHLFATLEGGGWRLRRLDWYESGSAHGGVG